MRQPHAPSLYAAAANPAPLYGPAEEDLRADVAIVGGGFTGLSAALSLAERGADPVVLEANSVGWGASGRNGGQMHSGQRRDQDWLESRFGIDRARQLWRLAEEAKAYTLGLIARHRIDCDWRLGLIDVVHKPRLVDEERAYVDKLRREYGYGAVDWLDRKAIADAVGTDGYYGGRIDRGAGHLDPLELARGLARAAAAAGARICEGSRVDHLSHDGKAYRVRIGQHTVRADQVILAGNGYLEGLDKDVDARVMPIDNYILATAPIGAGRPGGLIPEGQAISDSRFVVYYFRPSADGRLVFGGGETYARKGPSDIAGFVRRHMLKIYPQLEDVRIDYAWGGRLAITMQRLPFMREVKPGLFTSAGYSGQGVALAPYMGKVLADALYGDRSRFEAFSGLPITRFPGGRLLRYPALVAGMSWYAFCDRI